MTVKFGILGAGRIGQVHAQALSVVPKAEFIAVAEPMENVAQQMATDHGCDVRTIDEIANAKDIDAVIICTPTNTHADLIEQFCKARKAVFCEKPIDLDIERVKTCLKVVAETNGTLMVAFQRRFDPDFLALKKAITDGKIGDVEMITLTSRDPGAPPYSYIETSGGIFRDMTIHDLDVARWLLNEEVETVQAAASVLVDPKIGELGDYDSANLILRTTSGKQCTITNSRRASYGYDQRIEVHGSKGSVSAQNTHEARIEIANGEGYHKPPLQDFFMSRYALAYAGEIAAFVASLANNTPVPVTGEDGLAALALAEAALLSIKENRTVRVAEILV